MNEQNFNPSPKPPTIEDDNFMESLDTFRDQAIHNCRTMDKKEALKQAFKGAFPEIDICQE